jgi:hypothetical protein
MSTRPRTKKQFDAGKHHMPTEVHQLPQIDHVALAQVTKSIQLLEDVRGGILARVAVQNWGYPAGKELEFAPDYRTGEVGVIIVGEVQSGTTDQTNEVKES